MQKQIEHSANRRVPGQRSGFSLMEVSAAAAMLAVLLALTVQVVIVLSAQQQAAERRAFAVQAVHNLLELVENLSWEQVNEDTADLLRLPESVRGNLPSAKITVATAGETEPVEAKRVTIELAWSTMGGRPAAPVRMTTWVYPDSPPRDVREPQ
jgi:prepilin-type N-terminal cleavage/methylation domain-containing protein